ncbi:MAG: hypothetical protein ACLFRY_08500 [Spirochaetia bacterium]
MNVNSTPLDTVFKNGRVLTVNERDEVAEALGVRDDRTAPRTRCTVCTAADEPLTVSHYLKEGVRHACNYDERRC